MKKIVFSFGLFCLNILAVANDLNFLIVNATSSGNGSVNLTVMGGVAPFTYAWTGPSGFTANTEDISGLKTGNYTVTVTDKYCGVATYTVFVDISSDIQEENGALSLSVYPNPSNDQITITAGSDLNKACFKLITAKGETVMEKSNLNGSNFIFDISEQATGIYLIEINSNGLFSRVRFLKN